ncbi:BatA domain-containing protein, partial [bacterium]|nr:BatA domain-containing protein [bacterium]
LYMIFLNSIILYGIALISIPVIIHFLVRRKKEVISFSSLRFLKLLESSIIKKLKIQQIILLILRTLIILLIVLAFSRPAVRQTSASGSHSQTAAFIILDNSLSAMAGKGNTEFYNMMKPHIISIIDSFRENDPIYVVPLSEINNMKSLRPVSDKMKTVQLIKESKSSYISADLNDIIAKADNILSGTKNVNKELFICSDLQKSILPFSRRKDEEGNYVSSKLYLITDSEEDKENIGVDKVTIKNHISQKNKEIKIGAVITNYAYTPVKDLVINLYLDGRRTAQETISLDKQSSELVTFSVDPKASGFITGFVEIESDMLEGDNRRFFDLYIPQHIKALLVSEKTAVNSFIYTALNPDKSDSSLFHITVIEPSAFSAYDIKSYSTVIFDDVKNINNTDIYKLKSFLNSGRGVIIFPGDKTDPAYYNRITAPGLNLPKILSVHKENNEGFISFGRIDFNHPVLMELFEKKKRKIDSPKFRSFFTFEKKLPGRTIIEFSDGNPFLIETTYGRGKVMLFGCPPDVLWSDFPFKGIFAPLIYQSVSYTSFETFTQKKSILIGDEILYATRYKANEFIIEKPDGSREKPEIDIKSDNYSIRYGGTNLPGIYSLTADGTVMQLFSVNVNPKESELFKPQEKEIEKLTGADKIIYFDKEKDIPALISQMRLGREIGKYFIIAALLLLGVEMWIEKGGTAAFLRNFYTILVNRDG